MIAVVSEAAARRLVALRDVIGLMEAAFASLDAGRDARKSNLGEADAA